MLAYKPVHTSKKIQQVKSLHSKEVKSSSEWMWKNEVQTPGATTCVVSHALMHTDHKILTTLAEVRIPPTLILPKLQKIFVSLWETSTNPPLTTPKTKKPTIKPSQKSFIYREKGVLSKFSKRTTNTVKRKEGLNNLSLSYMGHLAPIEQQRKPFI